MTFYEFRRAQEDGRVHYGSSYIVSTFSQDDINRVRLSAVMTALIALATVNAGFAEYLIDIDMGIFLDALNDNNGRYEPITISLFME